LIFQRKFFWGWKLRLFLKYSNFQHGILKNNSLFNRACVVLVALLPVYYSEYWVCSEHPMLTKGGELKSMRERTPGVGGASYSVQEPSLGLL
jgi:hypothetical protein